MFFKGREDYRVEVVCGTLRIHIFTPGRSRHWSRHDLRVRSSSLAFEVLWREIVVFEGTVWYSLALGSGWQDLWAR